MNWRALWWLLAAVIGVVAYAKFVAAQEFHRHPKPGETHWYSRICCDLRDCYPTEVGEIEPVAEGFYIRANGETFTNRKRMFPSQDGKWHRCSLGGDPKRKTICIYYPALF